MFVFIINSLIIEQKLYSLHIDIFALILKYEIEKKYIFIKLINSVDGIMCKLLELLKGRTSNWNTEWRGIISYLSNFKIKDKEVEKIISSVRFDF
jgi:hypothetical protein